MVTRPFLAMTPAEIRKITSLPERIAWMACHFSPYGRGLSNLPSALPEQALLMVDDITPIHGHDPEIIAQQLLQCSQLQNFQGILLDFQRAENPETAELVQHLSQVLSCRLAVSEPYAEAAALPILVSPVPPSVPLPDHLSKWTDREIWLDISTRGEVLTVTESGTEVRPLPLGAFPENGFPEEQLHCHYLTKQMGNSIQFTLWRTEEDLSLLLEEAETLGVVQAVGLYQEYHMLINKQDGDQPRPQIFP